MAKKNRKTKTKRGVRNSVRKAPVAKNFKWKSQTKPFKSFRIQHTELVTDVESNDTATNFKVVNTLEINPGLRDTFPWLSGIAHNFERYKFHSLKFTFVPMLGTQTTGKVSLVPEYDAAESNDGMSKQQYASFEGYVSGSIWDKLICQLSPKNMSGGRSSHFIRRGILVGKQEDIKTYDVGVMIAALDAYGVDGTVGELYVSYDVTLMNPQLEVDVLTEEFQIEVSGNGDYTKPYNGTATVVNGKLSAEKVSDTRINVYEPGKYLVDFGTEIASTISGINLPTFASIDPAFSPPSPVTLYEPTGTMSSFTNYLSQILVNAAKPWYMNWTGLAAAGANNFFTNIVRVSNTYDPI